MRIEKQASSFWITFAVLVELLSKDTFQTTLKITSGVFTGEVMYA